MRNQCHGFGFGASGNFVKFLTFVDFLNLARERIGKESLAVEHENISPSLFAFPSSCARWNGYFHVEKFGFVGVF